VYYWSLFCIFTSSYCRIH